MFQKRTKKQMPEKTKRRLQKGLLALCMAFTFLVPVFGGGGSILKEPVIKGSAASAIEDVDLPLLVASAFGEARKAMNATDLEKQDTFIENTSRIVDNTKWQNIGLLVGPRDVLSGTTWSGYLTPTTLSEDELVTYGDQDLINAYRKYKAFGMAVQNLNQKAQRSKSSAVAINEGLDAMSTAVVKMGGFGVKFLNDYNPGPLLISFYDSSKMNDYPNNKWIQIVNEHEPLEAIVHTFGDPVEGLGISFFLVLGAMVAIMGFALSMFLILLGNRSFGDSIRKFLVRVVISAAGVYIIGNVFSVSLQWINSTIQDVETSGVQQYAAQNLNLYDWYLTGFQLPPGVELEIDETGNFVFEEDDVYAINKFTFARLYPDRGVSDELIRKQIESYTQFNNTGMASYVTPVYTNGGDGEGEGWNTDMLYAYMGVYSQNIDLHDPDAFNVDTESPIYNKRFNIYRSKYLYMSSLQVDPAGGGWTVYNRTNSDNYYGLNPISAFNLVRSDFSGSSISTIQNAYPTLGYAAFDITSGAVPAGDADGPHMNAITRFIACFTLLLATLRGFFTIITAGFAGFIAGGVRTSVGSAGGLGQALGAVVSLIGGILGISIIMSISISLLDVIYGIAMSLIGDVSVLEAFLEPMLSGLRGIPVLGPTLAVAARSGAEMIMTLVMALTIPKLGGIPINLFAQWMSDIPSRMSEKAMMLENMLMNGRGSAGYGGGGGSHAGQYTRSAQAQASRAFTSGAGQAALVIGSGVMAAKSLAGAGLASAGRALNKKGDQIEGKPENPGIAGWDDMTPQQQADAAHFAESQGSDWNNMDNDERRQAMEDAGIFNGTYDADGQAVKADDAGAPVTEDAPDTPVDVSEDAGYSDLGDNGSYVGPEPESLNSGADQTVDVGADQSVNAGPDGVTPSTDPNAPAGGTATPNVSGGTAEAGGMNPAAAGGTDRTVNGAADHHEAGAQTTAGTQTVSGGQETSGGQPQGTGEHHSLGSAGGGSSSSGNGPVTQISNNTSGDLHQRVENRQNVDGKQVGEFKQSLNETTMEQNVNEERGQGLDTAYQKEPAAPAMDRGAGMPAGGTTPGSVQAPADGLGMEGQRGLEAGNIVANSRSMTQVSADNRRQSSSNNSSQLHSSSQSAVTNNQAAGRSLSGRAEADRTAVPNEGLARGMNGTSRSQYGKQMTIREQRQARALHAVGDALQAAGGNRTMKEGFKDALGYAKDGFVTAAVPEEGQPLIRDIRMRRMERSQRELVQHSKKASEKDRKK